MRHPILATLSALLLALGLSGAANAGPFDDALAAANRRDYATTFRLWRPLADQGSSGACTWFKPAPKQFSRSHTRTEAGCSQPETTGNPNARWLRKT